jgi:hypothetical protein
MNTAALALLLALAGSDRPVDAPPFLAELRPFAGTWKRVLAGERTKKQKKEPALHLVIKEEQGKLRLRYQLPLRSKVYTSDWNGDVEVEMQVNVVEHHDVTLTTAAAPPRIDVSEHIHYGGTWRDRELRVESSYVLDEEGRLLLTCRSVRHGDEVIACPGPIVYQRVSDQTEWRFK